MAVEIMAVRLAILVVVVFVMAMAVLLYGSAMLAGNISGWW